MGTTSTDEHLHLATHFFGGLGRQGEEIALFTLSSEATESQIQRAGSSLEAITAEALVGYSARQ